MKPYETIQYMKDVKNMTEKEKRIRNRMKLHMKVVKNMTEKEKRI
jgi:hypothetical protein